MVMSPWKQGESGALNKTVTWLYFWVQITDQYRPGGRMWPWGATIGQSCSRCFRLNLITSHSLCLLRHSRHVPGELMSVPWLAWLVRVCTLMTHFLMATDEAQLLICVVISAKQKRGLRRRNYFQVGYLLDSHYSINSMPITAGVTALFCRSALLLVSAALVPLDTSLICCTVLANCGPHQRLYVAVSLSLKVNTLFSLTLFWHKASKGY